MSKNKALKVHLIQMRSIDSFEKNLSFILKSLTKVSFDSRHHHLVALPENCLYFRLNKKEAMPFIDLNNKVFIPLIELAKKKKIHLVLGSVPLLINSQKYSSVVYIDSNGDISSPFQKNNLFNINLPGNVVKESDVFSRGTGKSILTIGHWKLGLSICFDLRFSDIFHYYRTQKVDAVLVPAAFTVPTGKAHWEILIRARAIELQGYILAPAQSGSHLGKRETFGHSMIVDPWGEVVKLKKKGLGVISFVLDKSFLSQVRQKIPMG